MDANEADEDRKPQSITDRKRARELGVEQSIREAMARGDFDDLPGKGKPLSWDSPRDDDTWLASHLLKNAGYRPLVVERDAAIRAEKEALAALLADHLAWHRAHAAEEPPAALAHAARLVEGRYRERAQKLNREIDSHNVAVPLDSMQHTKLPIEAKVEAFWRALGLPPK
jgi:DnaJ family protein C protein 28